MREFLSLQRDLYAYVHDQTVRLINAGATALEIAESLELPPILERTWHTRGYYGSVKHNVKAIYQRYLGWYDGNPAHLWTYPPVEEARRYVEAIGGLDRVVELAREARDTSDYRWAVTLLNHAVFASPEAEEPRLLLADTFTQLAYAEENATWRNSFLTAAAELREGGPLGDAGRQTSALAEHLSPEQLLDVIAFSVNGPRAWGVQLSVNILFTDVDSAHRLELRNGVLVHRRGTAAGSDASVRLTRKQLLSLLGGNRAESVEVTGDPEALRTLVGSLDRPDRRFAVVVP